MNNKTNFYEAPACVQVEVRVESTFLNTLSNNSDGSSNINGNDVKTQDGWGGLLGN